MPIEGSGGQAPGDAVNQVVEACNQELSRVAERTDLNKEQRDQLNKNIQGIITGVQAMGGGVQDMTGKVGTGIGVKPGPATPPPGWNHGGATKPTKPATKPGAGEVNTLPHPYDPSRQEGQDRDSQPPGTRPGYDYPGPSYPDLGLPPDMPAPDRTPDQTEATLPAQPTPAWRSRFWGVASGYLQRGSPADAGRVLDRYIELAPQDPQFLSLRSAARFQQQRYAEAQDDARAALRLDPGNKLASDFAGLAGAYLRGISNPKNLSSPDFAGAREEAAGAGPAAAPLSRQVLPPGRALPPASPLPGMQGGMPPMQAMVQRAAEQVRMRDYAGAQTTLSVVIDAEPRNQNAWALRAEVFNRRGEHRLAKNDAEEALKLDPKSAVALRQRSFALYGLRDYEGALRDADAAISLEPGNAVGHVCRAWALEKLDRLKEALLSFEVAARLDPGNRTLLEDFLKRTGKGPASGTGLAGRVRAGLAPRMLVGGAALVLLILGIWGALGRASGRTGRAVTGRPEAQPRPQAQPGPQAPAVLEPGTLLAGNYRVVKTVGRGGMGVVYEAADEALQRRVAVKQLSPPDRSPEYLERFIKEARLVAKLSHPNLVQIYAVIEDNGEYFLVFEYVEGGTLDDLLSSKGRLAPAESLPILRGLCDALDYAHAERVIHRDLKPSNVMLAQGGCKVMDFGIAHQARTASLQTQTAAWGTPPYMAPEQELGRVSRGSDLYSLGVMAYELVTGKRPFDGMYSLEDKLKKRYTPATKLTPDIPAGLDAFFEKALDPEPEKRPRTAREFIQAFESALRPGA